MSDMHNLSELYTREELLVLDKKFLSFLPGDFAAELASYRNNNGKKGKDLSLFLIELAKALEDFLYNYFALAPKNKNEDDYLVAQTKRSFIQRKVLQKYKSLPEDIKDPEIVVSAEFELNFCHQLTQATPEQIEELERLAAYILYHDSYESMRRNSVLFNLPKKYNGEYLFDFARDENEAIITKYPRFRYGFNLTDDGKSDSYTIDQTNYCIFCHNQQKDSCSHGMKDNEGEFKTHPTSGSLALGCPLGEKISEMNYLKFHGHNLAAFALILMDNPMVAATGHRICNDCMQSCIYQKQEPVNIPQIETSILQEILSMDYGFELYNLLVMWNPLLPINYLPGAIKEQKILVVGLGPAGFTLTHYLSKMGYQVLAIDGLKIPPIEQKLLQPIIHIDNMFENLSNRDSDGFGGVMEYGITNRWNKNYLKLIRAMLERRNNVNIMGGIRLGSNISIEQAKELGINHIALCTGAGKPNIPSVPDILVRGVRTASDFLMNLQSGASFKFDSLSNLQIRMPVLVIGGGLTAVDTATEASAYYLIQIEKFYQQYQKHGKALTLTIEEQLIAEEFLNHALLARIELKKDQPNIAKLIDGFGGVRILYRKNIKDSPAYKNNHEELEKALEEGVKFFEYIEPKQVICDDFGHLKILKTIYKGKGVVDFPARTMLLAAGTSPNITLADEEKAFLQIDGIFLQLLDQDGILTMPEGNAKPKKDSFLTCRQKDFSISFFGDAHPSYAGNVVKAIASSKNGHSHICEVLEGVMAKGEMVQIKSLLTSTVRDVKVLNKGGDIVEIIIHSPLAAQNFQPGQFFRLQNYGSNLGIKQGSFEPLALTGASVDREKGLISLIVLEMGGSSSLCRLLQKGEEVCLMGPTGAATEIPQTDKSILLIGGGLGNAVLFSIGQEARKKGCKVTYFAGYRRNTDLFKQEEIEKAADQIFWCCDQEIDINAREQDQVFTGNMIEALEYHTKDTLGQFDRIITIGSSGLMASVKIFLQNNKKCMKRTAQTIASINSPMQCMMKEICAQCLQKHKDQNGLETYVYSCKNQDQHIEEVDFEHLFARLQQNSLLEKIMRAKLSST